MKKSFSLLLVFLFLVSCKTGRLTDASQVAENEAIVIANVKILNHGKDITKNSRIYFDENQKGILSYKLKEDGVLIMKVPYGV